MKQPAIWGVTPTTAAPGDAITVTGSNFGTTGTLSFNGQPLTVKSWSAERIAATLPDDLTLGAGLIQIKTAGKQNRNGQCFQIRRFPGKFIPMPKASKWTGLTGFFKIDRIDKQYLYAVNPAKSC